MNELATTKKVQRGRRSNQVMMNAAATEHEKSDTDVYDV